MSFVPWFDFWRSLWFSPDKHPCDKTSECKLDELTAALENYLTSAREVAARAATNVDDAERIMAALRLILERKRAAQQAASAASQTTAHADTRQH